MLLSSSLELFICLSTHTFLLFTSMENSEAREKSLKKCNKAAQNNIFNAFFSNFTLDMDPIFGAISAVDHADCGKLLVCNVFAKTQNELTTEEDLLGKVTYPKYYKHSNQSVAFAVFCG